MKYEVVVAYGLQTAGAIVTPNEPYLSDLLARGFIKPIRVAQPIKKVEPAPEPIVGPVVEETAIEASAETATRRRRRSRKETPSWLA